MLKVNHSDLETITKFLDKIANKPITIKDTKKAKELSDMIKNKYTEIKP
jgi:hypothetical protein